MATEVPSDRPGPSKEVLEFKSLSAEEAAAEKAKEEAAALSLEQGEFDKEVARIKRLQVALGDCPPEFILAAAVDRHTAAMNRIADAVVEFNDQFKRAVDVFGQQAEWERSGVK